MRKPLTYTYYLAKGKRRTHAIKQMDAIPWMNRHGNRFAGKDVESAAEIQNRMAEDIRTGRPFMAGRLGAVELAALFFLIILLRGHVKLVMMCI